jgi:hypothetical protein
MSVYEDRFNEAKLPQRITEVEQRLGNLDEATLDRTTEGGVARVQAALDKASVVVGISDPVLVSPPRLQRLVEVLDGLRNTLDEFQAEALTFENVDGATDELIEQLARWPAGSGIPADEVKEAASRFRRSAAQQLVALENEASGTQAKLAELQSQLDEIRTRSEEAANSSSARVEELTNTVNEQKGRLEEAIRSNQEQFSKAQEERVARFGEQTADLETRIGQVENESKQRLSEIEGRLEEEVSSAQETLNDHLADAQRIVGAIATTGTVGGFQQEADSQLKTADRFRMLAVIAGLGAVALAVWGVVHAGQTSGDSTDVLAKALASFVFFGIAGYLATQSGKHRAREERARRRELELAAFGPFIADLPPDKQQELVAKLADRMFGHEPPGDGDGNGITEENVSVVGQLFSIFNRASS